MLNINSIQKYKRKWLIYRAIVDNNINCYQHISVAIKRYIHYNLRNSFHC